MKEVGFANTGKTITLPANSIMTLVGDNFLPVASTATIKSNADANSLLVYPHPSNDGFTINFTQLAAIDMQLELLNPRGNVVIPFLNILQSKKDIQKYNHIYV